MFTGPNSEMIIMIMSGSGESKDGGHWDNHPTCRSCMRKTGQVCSLSEPCGVCSSWPAELWVKVKQRSAKQRIARAQAHLSGVQAGSGKGQTGLPRIEDKPSVAPDARSDPQIEAKPRIKARPQIEAPVGGVGEFKVPQLDTAGSAARLRDVARAPQGGVRPRIEATKTDGVSPLH